MSTVTIILVLWLCVFFIIGYFILKSLKGSIELESAKTISSSEEINKGIFHLGKNLMDGNKLYVSIIS
jgi:hypothetical protein